MATFTNTAKNLVSMGNVSKNVSTFTNQLGQGFSEYLSTQAFDFLMTEDSDYLVTRRATAYSNEIKN